MVTLKFYALRFGCYSKSCCVLYVITYARLVDRKARLLYAIEWRVIAGCSGELVWDHMVKL